MNADLALTAAKDLLADWVIETTQPETDRCDIQIDVENLLSAITRLVTARWGYLAAITGLDLGGQLEVLYHFCAGAAVLTLRLRVSSDHALVPSISGVLPAASFYERELREMFGVELPGLANVDHLFLPDDWPDNVYPLRKDAELK